ncbi:2-keto-4-pentenoate hydratase [Sphingomonas sp. 1P08PE]|uniref:2-keto-4-pentenoate hydratase n=1 Tax=Sphingomonas sp. 1P08PE TaxID=554122 RepID=UPI0039A13B5C
MTRMLGWLGLAIGLSACTAHGPGRDYLARFVTAERQAQPFDPITATMPGVDMDRAYRLQRDYVRQRLDAGDRIAGYKGGLMSTASLAARHVTEPLVGTLFASGRADDGATISLCGYRKASFELKLGYVGQAVLPVIDLPDIAYRDPDRYGAIDMIAANISAARYVRGTPRPAAGIDLDTVPAALFRDGERIAAGSSGESLGGQRYSREAVLALARRTGRTPTDGDLVVTGKMGDRGWLSPGRYVADYGPLGRVGFTVVACTS